MIEFGFDAGGNEIPANQVCEECWGRGYWYACDGGGPRFRVRCSSCDGTGRKSKAQAKGRERQA